MTTQDGNHEQRTYWNDQAGPKWVRLQQRLDAQIEPLGHAALQRAHVDQGERVLDISCGCGQTTLELAQRVGQNGVVTGIDLSQPMLERARERQNELRLAQVNFIQGDAQVHDFPPGYYDVAFSRFGVMFFADPAAAFRNICAALKPQGRVCFVCWQGLDKNDWAKIPLKAAAQHVQLPPPPAPGAPGPFAFGDPERVRHILTAGGFVEIDFVPYEAQLSMGGATSVDEAVAFTLEIGPVAMLLREASEQTAALVQSALTNALSAYATPGRVQLGGAVWLVSARRGG